MKDCLQDAGYVFNRQKRIWHRSKYTSIHYSDGDETELRLASIIDHATDRTVFSPELRRSCTDWPSVYHLSGSRANLLRPFQSTLSGNILEIGAGCGAITRYLGESGANVLALEGSLRRATIARSRTSGLENVTILAERFDDFRSDRLFDFITLIGVLEYANLFTSGENAHFSMLERVRSLLKPEGRLIIGIENQLGLKYFAGSLEDHVGHAMYGIENRYRNDQPQTFGRKVLAEMLDQAGFAATEFLVPYPDYKLPSSIVTEKGFADKSFDASAFAWQTVRRDWQLPEYSNFSLELAWPELIKNGLALDVANSFLVVASSSDHGLIEKDVLAYHYSTERVPQYCKETRFVKRNSEIEVVYQRLALPPEEAQEMHIRVVEFNCPPSAKYSYGRTLAWEFVQIVTMDGWVIEEIGRFVKRYIGLLEIFTAEDGKPRALSDVDVYLPGRFFDLVPQNIIIDSDGSSEVIDAEWFLPNDFKLGQLLWRAMWTLQPAVTRFGHNATGAVFSRVEFVLKALEAAGFELTKNDLNQFMEFESLVQEQVTGDSMSNFFSAWPKQQLPIYNLGQVLIERNQQITDLNQEILRRDKLIALLSSFRDEVFNSTSWRLTNPLRVFFRHVKGNRYGSDFIRFVTNSSSALNTLLGQPFRFGRTVSAGSKRKERVEDIIQNPESNDSVSGRVNWSLFLPATTGLKELSAEKQKVVDIVVPVYRGLEQTRRCLNSVLESGATTPFRVIIINDASPEPALVSYLQTLSSSQRVILVENSENIGFPATVNRGMEWSDVNDVVLLNSDTEVAGDWLAKLNAHAWSDLKIGTVTPFSNNGTICNYPSLEGMKDLPDGETVGSFDAACASGNNGRSIEIPTAVGFCVYIRRDCLDDVGLFDVETFGKGYGEENDFCLRADGKGWKHLLAADTFVFHEGEVSFRERSNFRQEQALNTLRNLYPEYEAKVVSHLRKNEIYPLRAAVTAARFRQSHLPVVLHVLHCYGGGTEKHVQELCLKHQGKAKLLIMTPPFVEKGNNTLQIRSADSFDALQIDLPFINLNFLISLLKAFGVSLVHVHHKLGYPFDLYEFIKALGTPYYLTVHDYMLICPRINLMSDTKKYCGEPESDECNRCLSSDYPLGAKDILKWRESHADFINDASLVICPSHDTANRLQRYFPQALYRVIPHEKVLASKYLDIEVPAIKKNEPLRVAILGVLAINKGSELIADALDIVDKTNALLQFRLIGHGEGSMAPVAENIFSQTGSYDDDDLQNLIEEYNPHLILFPARWPETYSYTLLAALKSRRPLMTPDLGAFPERVSWRSWVFVFGWDITPVHLVDKLCEIRRNNFCTKMAPESIAGKEVTNFGFNEDAVFYDSGYFKVMEKSFS